MRDRLDNIMRNIIYHYNLSGNYKSSENRKENNLTIIITIKITNTSSQSHPYSVIKQIVDNRNIHVYVYTCLCTCLYKCIYINIYIYIHVYSSYI